jgi:aclacinomycin oxidase
VAAVGLAGTLGAGSAQAETSASASAGASTSTGASAADSGAGASAAAPGGGLPAFGPVSIGPQDPRYLSMLFGDNFRFTGSPDEVRVVSTTADVLRAVQQAVDSGRWIAPRSGGHCFEGFTADPGIRVLLDVSPMDAVGFDPAMNAFLVEPGARLGAVYTALFKGWGVTIPAGGCPDVGAGGHFVGGGYGPLSRRYGSVVDHLYAVEVVVVDAHGTARAVVATREPHDPNRDLWWAHTGGGGGNFGVVTKYWLRAPGATGSDPAKLLPPAPAQMYFRLVTWQWSQFTEEGQFTALLRNFGTWHERNSAPGSPGTGVYAVLNPTHSSAGSFYMVIQADNGLPNIDEIATGLVDAVVADTGTTPSDDKGPAPWLHMVSWPGDGEGGDKLTRRLKLKAGYLRKGYSDTQLSAIYQALTDKTGTPDKGMLLVGYGGQVQAVSPTATAVAQRDVVMKAVFQSAWFSADEDAANIAWVQQFYRSVYAETGGAPVPDAVSHGSYINYPDVDLADPTQNTSGVPWYELYYGQNYPRLQQIKAKWDPRDVFHHAMSVQPPA